MNHLLEELSVWNVVCYNSNEINAMLEQLWISVEQVKDSILVAEHCIPVALPTFSSTSKLLQQCVAKVIN